MNVLIITPTPTHPMDQGNRVRVNQIGSSIQDAGGNVDLLYYDLDGLSGSAIDLMRKKWGRLFVVRPKEYSFRKKFAQAWGVDDWVSASLIDTVRFLAERVRYDVVLVNYVWLSACLTVFDDDVVKIIDTHDAFGGRHETSRALGMDPSWFYTTVEEEARGLNRADYVVAIQEAEGRYFRSTTQADVRVLEYAPAPCYLPVRNSPVITVGYLGSGNPWNVRSVEEFDKQLASLFSDRTLDNEVSFLLFGGITKTIKPLEIFRPVGMVDVAQDFYMGCDISINPMIGGTGLKIKTVESLAFGCPIVTTKAGADGMDCIPPELVCDDIQQIAERVWQLCQHPETISHYKAAVEAGYEAHFRNTQRKVDETVALWLSR